jgi:hypothetical protein
MPSILTNNPIINSKYFRNLFRNIHIHLTSRMKITDFKTDQDLVRYTVEKRGIRVKIKR